VDAVTSTAGGAGGVGSGPAAGGAPTFGSAAQSAPLLVPKQFHCDCRPGWMGSTCNTGIYKTKNTQICDTSINYILRPSPYLIFIDLRGVSHGDMTISHLNYI